MDNINKTMYIPLYGKAYVSRKGILLQDTKAEEIWAAEGFALKGKSKSKWLAYYMAMRARVFDQWLQKKMTADPSAVVLHLGCGMDSRVLRVGAVERQNSVECQDFAECHNHLNCQGYAASQETRIGHWYDVDFPEVIAERKRYYQDNNYYHMVASDVRDSHWMEQIPADHHAIVVLEGVSMYLTPEELSGVLASLNGHFAQVQILMDCYTTFAAKASKYKNPINDVGVTQVYGLDDPAVLEAGTRLRYVREHEMTPGIMMDELTGMERTIFRKLYGGKLARKMYRMYEYEGEKE